MEVALYREKHGINRSSTMRGFPVWESENFSSKCYAVYMFVCILLPSKYLSKVTLYRTPNETIFTRTLASIAHLRNSRFLLQIEFAFRCRSERH